MASIEQAPQPPQTGGFEPEGGVPGSVTFYPRSVKKMRKLLKNMQALSHEMAMTRTRDGVKPAILENWKHAVQSYTKDFEKILTLR